MKRLVSVLLFGAAFCFYAPASDAQTERFLIPTVAHEPIPGAFGSLWVTEIAGRNVGLAEVPLRFPCEPDYPLCTYMSIPPGGSFSHPTPWSRNSPHGTVLETFSGVADHLLITARVRDLSRGHLTWGTEIPIVRESRVTGTPITLLDVPNAERFRLTLRMYDFEHNVGNFFVVRAFALTGDVPLAEITVPMSLLTDSDGMSQGLYFAVISELPLPADAPERLRLEIQTAIPTKYWAFASLTNNETQHVTVISPTRPGSD